MPRAAALPRPANMLAPMPAPAKPPVPAAPSPLASAGVGGDDRGLEEDSTTIEKSSSDDRKGERREKAPAPSEELAASSSIVHGVTQLARKSAQQRAQTDRPKGKASLPDPTVLPPPTPSILANRSVGQRDVKHV